MLNFIPLIYNIILFSQNCQNKSFIYIHITYLFLCIDHFNTNINQLGLILPLVIFLFSDKSLLGLLLNVLLYTCSPIYFLIVTVISFLPYENVYYYSHNEDIDQLYFSDIVVLLPCSAKDIYRMSHSSLYVTCLMIIFIVISGNFNFLLILLPYYMCIKIRHQFIVGNNISINYNYSYLNCVLPEFNKLY